MEKKVASLSLSPKALCVRFMFYVVQMIIMNVVSLQIFSCSFKLLSNHGDRKSHFELRTRIYSFAALDKDRWTEDILIIVSFIRVDLSKNMLTLVRIEISIMVVDLRCPNEYFLRVLRLFCWSYLKFP